MAMNPFLASFIRRNKMDGLDIGETVCELIQGR